MLTNSDGVFISRKEVESNIKRLENILLSYALNDFGTEEKTGEAALWRELDIWKELLNRCEELNPWLPIESAPKDREILVFAPRHDGLRSLKQVSKYHPDAGFCIDELRVVTHFQELPEDPK